MFQTLRKPHQGPCICEDCGKPMRWEGIDWCIVNALYLLCSSCTQRWVKENRYRRETREKPTPLREFAAMA